MKFKFFDCSFVHVFIVLLLLGCDEQGEQATPYESFIFPQTSGNTWEYGQQGEVKESTNTINNQKVRSLNYPSKYKEYFYEDNQSLYFSGVYTPSIVVAGEGSFSLNIPIIIQDAGFSIWKLSFIRFFNWLPNWGNVV